MKHDIEKDLVGIEGTQLEGLMLGDYVIKQMTISSITLVLAIVAAILGHFAHQPWFYPLAIILGVAGFHRVFNQRFTRLHERFINNPYVKAELEDKR